jgi:hypothetical protein
VVSHLAFVGCGRQSGSDGNAVELRRTRHVKLDSLEVSDFRLSGVSSAGDENTRITRVYAHKNGFAGISTSGEHGTARTKNLYIGYCAAANNPGDPKNLSNHSGNGIVVGGVDDGLVEYCEAFDNGWDMPRQMPTVAATRCDRHRSGNAAQILTKNRLAGWLHGYRNF